MDSNPMSSGPGPKFKGGLKRQKNHQSTRGVQAMADYGCTQDGEQPELAEDVRDVLARITHQMARLREENDELRTRVHRLEARSGRGLLHPSDSL